KGRGKNLESIKEIAASESSTMSEVPSSPSPVLCAALPVVHNEETQEMTMEAAALKEQAVCSFYLEGKCRFGNQCFNLHLPDLLAKNKKDQLKCKGKKKVRRKSPPPEEDDRRGKKPPMKTAGDVRNRILWDAMLEKEYFTVGYLDRFVGIVEKPFTDFTWEHLALVDVDELAIPQHRIQYFSYKGTKVWDKNERLDNVFGSTGSDVDIYDLMQEIDLEQEEKLRTFDPDASDSDDDDEAIVMTNTEGIKERVVAQKEEFDKLRATHFLCIRVHNEEVKNAVAEVQEQIIMAEPVLRSCAMPTELMHVTLAMIRINSPDAMVALTDLLQEIQPKIQALLAQPQQKHIIVKGLSTFGARVLYAKLQIPEAFNALVQMLQESLANIDDLLITNHFDFVPHMTLIKISRPVARERRSKYLNSALYSDYIEKEFGIIDINNINLCFIDDKRGHDGFYVTCKAIRI
ncbi:Solute carrier 7 member 3, partial [Halocaridina rubra]